MLWWTYSNQRGLLVLVDSNDYKGVKWERADEQKPVSDVRRIKREMNTLRYQERQTASGRVPSKE